MFKAFKVVELIRGRWLLSLDHIQLWSMGLDFTLQFIGIVCLVWHRPHLYLILFTFHVLPCTQIPLSVEQIRSAQHPVKAGLSDAFMVLSPPPKSTGQSRSDDKALVCPSCPSFLPVQWAQRSWCLQFYGLLCFCCRCKTTDNLWVPSGSNRHSKDHKSLCFRVYCNAK